MHLPCLQLGSVHLGSREMVFWFYQVSLTQHYIAIGIRYLFIWTEWKLFLFSLEFTRCRFLSFLKVFFHESSELFLLISVDRYFIFQIFIHCLHIEISVILVFIYGAILQDSSPKMKVYTYSEGYWMYATAMWCVLLSYHTLKVYTYCEGVL
jgi:hypothetical protein